MNFYLDAWKKFATFSGRSRRKEFWIFWLVNSAVSYLLQLITGNLGLAGTIILGVFGLAILIPSLAVAIRRMHDIGKSGWWLCVNMIPLAGSIWYIVLAAKDSEPGSNQWGVCPK
jgi:uncharacterized membrane protein YhaH (DUF805 family)